eukprot:TRINITY_DN8699_c0_g2_i1.p1 TRINITY_DN8699_c0_g2~~TRINITY_DN8699_c0_g2_i1.p1  ORF type:complete len:387 (+),score=127.09 TRINITY_DN8699_c0_g2_i1:73-1161(+)
MAKDKHSQSQNFLRYIKMTDEEIENRPISTDPHKGVPIVDISGLIAEDVPTLDTPGVAEFVEACKEWGFIQVKQHGVPDDYFNKMLDYSKRFFALPDDVKDSIRRTPDNTKGFFDDEYTKRMVDWKECFDYGMCKGVFDGGKEADGWNVWLDEDKPEAASVKGMHDFFKDYMLTLRGLGFKLLSAMAVGLGLPHDALHKYYAEDSTFCRLNHYRPCPNPKKFAIAHHTDAGGITILHQQNVNALQVLNFEDLIWYPIPPVDGALVINIGDVMQVWANDHYLASVHRVASNQNLERFSIPTFFNPGFDTVYEPQEGTGEAVYRPISWREFRTKRAQDDLADLGAAETQIFHYRTDVDLRQVAA